MSALNMPALNQIRILDLSQGPACGLASMILADFGAEVLQIRRPDAADTPLMQLGSAPLWQRGKQYLTLDLHTPDARATLDELLAAADVLLINWRPNSLASSGLDFDTLHVQYPQLIMCHVSGFGSTGPRAELPAYEHVVAAATGRMMTFAGIVDRPGPVFSALQVGTHATAQSATAGILAALHARSATGEGRLVETSLLQGMLPYEQGAMIGKQFPERFAAMYAVADTPEPPMPSLYYHPAQAGDGTWMQFGNLLPHLFDNFLLVTELMDVVADADFEPSQLLLTDKHKHEAFRERMLTRIQSQSAADWMTACIENGGVVATSYQTTQQALRDPDIVANGHAIEREDGVQLGPLARLSATPAAPGPVCCDGTARAQAWRDTPRTKTSLATADNTLPLAGIRVVEIATIIAAPLGASFLADMGADVIKVEQIGGDPYRGLAMGVGSARVNAGKRSISVDLKSVEGTRIVKELARGADILIHNYRPGVPERLGIDYAALSADNPQLIYLQSNGYGPDGPGALRPSTHPIPGAAMGGVLYQMGERVPDTIQDMDSLRRWTRRLMRANEVNPDPNTALVVATSCLLGLVARDQTGAGQRILIDMFGANAYANHDDFLDYPNKPPRPLPDDGLHGLSPTYRLYRCADDQWVFLAAVTRRERERLSHCLDAAHIDLDLLEANDAHTAEVLGELFKSASAEVWEARLADQGVACVRADGQDPARFWLQDAQSQALNLTHPVAHPIWGAYQRHGANVHFDGAPPHLAPPPIAGQHNREVLSELGYSTADITHLEQQNVIWAEVADRT